MKTDSKANAHLFAAELVSLGGLGGSIIVRVVPCGSVADKEKVN